MALNETMAHESGHMIYFHRKFLMNDQPTAWENIYLNEAIAAMAQDLTGMTGGNFFVVQAGLDEIERFCAFDIMNATGGYIMDRDGALRGGAYLFLRYLYDQNGGDHAESDGTITDTGGVAWLNGWVDGPSLGLANIASSTGMDAEDVIFDFYTTLIVSNRGPDSAPITDDPRFNYLPTQEDPLTTRTRGADMYGSFRDMFSLSGPAYGTIEYNDGQILSTGVQYLLFTADGIADISLTVDAEAEARLRIVRVE